MRRSSIRRPAVAAVVALSLLTASPAGAQLAVYDPTNYASNVLQAARALEQINNQIRALQNQALSLRCESKAGRCENAPATKSDLHRTRRFRPNERRRSRRPGQRQMLSPAPIARPGAPLGEAPPGTDGTGFRSMSGQKRTGRLRLESTAARRLRPTPSARGPDRMSTVAVDVPDCSETDAAERLRG